MRRTELPVSPCLHIFIWKNGSQHLPSSCRSCKVARTRNATYNRNKLLKSITCSWPAWWFLSSVLAHLIPILTAVLHELLPHFREQQEKADSWLASFGWAACELPWLMRHIWHLPPRTMISYTYNRQVKLLCGESTLSRMNWAQLVTWTSHGPGAKGWTSPLCRLCSREVSELVLHVLVQGLETI